MKWWYLSFAGDEGFRGAVYIQAEDFLAATLRACVLGINPGGEVLGLECPDEHVPAPEFRERLLAQDEIPGGAFRVTR